MNMQVPGWNKTNEYLIEQYKSLKKEIGSIVSQSWKLEIYAVAGVAAFSTWAVKEKYHRRVWFIACLLPIFGGLRSVGLYGRISQIAGYLRDFESANGIPSWELALGASRLRISTISLLFWIILLLATIAAPFILAH